MMRFDTYLRLKRIIQKFQTSSIYTNLRKDNMNQDRSNGCS